MDLLELISRAQEHDNEAILSLFQKFKSLILKYTYLLNYDDAKSDLDLFFLELIFKISLKDFIGRASNYRLLSYIKQSIHRYYIFLSKQKTEYQIHNLLSEELPTYTPYNATDNTIIHEFIELQSPIDRKIIKYRYWGYSNAEIGQKLNLSRQSIHRHIQKIKANYLNWQK